MGQRVKKKNASIKGRLYDPQFNRIYVNIHDVQASDKTVMNTRTYTARMHIIQLHFFLKVEFIKIPTIRIITNRSDYH